MTFHLNRNTTPIIMRNYGRVVQDMIAYACTIENEQDRAALEVYIAQCMRQRNLVWNRDQETGLQRVKDDIIRLSGGRLQCSSIDFEQLVMQAPVQTAKKKKK